MYDNPTHVIMQTALCRRGFFTTNRPAIDYSALTKKKKVVTTSHTSSRHVK